LHEARGDIFEEVFARSWSLLTDDARRILMVMPIFAASTSRAAIEAASDVHHFALDEGLGQLVEMWLVEVSEELDEAKRRYSVHPLTRAFAGAELNKEAGFRKDACLRLASHFGDLIEQCGAKQWWDTQNLSMSQLEVLERERENILAIIKSCFEMGELQLVIRLVWGMNAVLGIRGYWDDRLIYGALALQAAERLKDNDVLAWLRTTTGWVYLKRGNYEKAKELAAGGLQIFEDLGDWEGACNATRILARVAGAQGEIDEAKRLTARALEQAQVQGNNNLVSDICRDIGDFALQQGKLAEAQSWYERAVDVLEKGGNEERLTNILISFGSVMFMQRKTEDAERLYQESMVLAQRTGRQDNIARAIHGLAKVNEQQQFIEGALNRAQEALEMYIRLGMRKESEEAQVLVERLEGKLSAQVRCTD